MGKLTYESSGVNIEAGDASVQDIKELANKTKIPGVLGNIGHFGAFFQPSLKGLKEPILVSSTDGVGTKLKLAFATGIHNTVGIDLVAMSVNDLICCGAQPLFFLDYIAIQKLEPSIVKQIVSGITEGCKQAGCALIGGETAELTDMYAKGEYDLAGFAVGIVDKEKIIDGSKIKAGDKIVALASSGLHSNGYTLARKALGKEHYKEMLTPTKIYAKDIADILKKNINVHGIANITGGGLPSKLGRIIPNGLQAKINKNSWKIPKIFQDIQEKGNIDEIEMYKTFNMGIGMVLVVPDSEAKKIEQGFVIGEITKGKEKVSIK
ncbi:phosphoribosylformylglycinamidine cyclo-ligase [Candidatus Margulisiibacteriota bacterium]